MKEPTKKLVNSIASALLDAAHEGAKAAVNDAARRVHAELERQKRNGKKKLERWACK